MMGKIVVAIGVTCVSARVVRVSAVVKDSDTKKSGIKLDEDEFSGTAVSDRYKTFLEKRTGKSVESSAAEPTSTAQTPIPTSLAPEEPLTARDSAIKLARSLGGHKECQDGLTKYLRRGYASINQVLRGSLRRAPSEPDSEYIPRFEEAKKDSRLAMCGLEIKREEKRDPEGSSSADRDFREGGLVSRSFIATAEMMEGGENDRYIVDKCKEVRKIYEKPNNIVTEDAFMSTTVSTEPFMGSHVLVIRVPPKNNLGVRVETPEEANAGDEKEVLFPPGQRLRILKVIPRDKLEKFTNFFENQKVTDFFGNHDVVVTKAAAITDAEKIQNIQENLDTLLRGGANDGKLPFRKSNLGKIISDEDDHERNRVITSKADYNYVMQTLLQVRKKSLKPRTGDAEYGARTLILAEMLDEDQESHTTAWGRYETFLKQLIGSNNCEV